MVVTRSRPGAEGDDLGRHRHEISELKQWQQELVAAKEQAVLASRSKSQFLRS